MWREGNRSTIVGLFTLIAAFGLLACGQAPASTDASQQIATPNSGSVSATSAASPTPPDVLPPPRAREYPGIRWIKDGKAVWASEIALIEPPANCYPGALLLAIGWPPGRSMKTDLDGRQYVRDPDGLYLDRTVGPFDGSAVMPPDAIFSGYRYDDNELWLANSTVDREVYFVRPGGIAEAWPRAPSFLACA